MLESHIQMLDYNIVWQEVKFLKSFEESCKLEV